MASTRRLSAIVFTDVEGFSAATHADERAALRSLQSQAEIVRPLLARHHGREVKAIGDGLLLEFPNARDAIECVVELQRQIHEHNAQSGGRPLRIRAGIHLGDVEERAGDILGDAVNIASRVEALADAGGICLTAQVYDQVRNKVPFRFEREGPTRLKGISEPVEVYRVSLPWEQVSVQSPAPGTLRLAVLPLANISPDSQDAYLADGLTEELIAVLSRLRGLRVIARTSVSAYRNASKPVREIGAELGVGIVIEGSVRRAGDRLRITLQLIDTESEEHRWAETFDRDLRDVFELQAEIAEKTAAALRLELLGPEREALHRTPTSDLRAYEAYLRGVAAFQRTADEGWTRAGVEEAAEFFEAAIAQDPGAAAPRAALANLLIAAMGEVLRRSEVGPRAHELVEEALRLDPSSPDAHVARGNVALQFESDWARAEEEFRTALEINPSSGPAFGWYGILLYTLGRFEESEQMFSAMQKVDPLFRQAVYWRLRALQQAGASDAALELAHQQIARDPGNRFLHLLLGQLWLQLGRPEDAQREANLAQGPASGTTHRVARALLLAQLGHPEEARAIVESWDPSLRTGYVRPEYVAALWAVLGEKEKALALLETDTRDGERSLWIGFRRPEFDSIRSDARFIALLRELRLPVA